MISATVVLTPRREGIRYYIDESPINLWLIKNVGANARYKDLIGEDRPWHVSHMWNGLEYSFHREEDATLFALRWA
jgi:hypothetical protein